MTTLVVTGATGLIGARVVELLKKKINVIGLSSKDLDITSEENVSKVLKGISYDVVVHCAGYTNVDLAEKEKEKAKIINVEGALNVAREVHRADKKLIHISTDFVFDGTQPPYIESSTPHPLGWYAQTKYDAEIAVHTMATIVRISYPYGISPAPKKDFVQRIRELLTNGIALKMSYDAQMTPTFIDDIANGLFTLITDTQSSGIYHLVGSSSISPYDAGLRIAQKYGLPVSLISKTTLAEHTRGKTPRPLHGIIKDTRLHIPMRSFEEGLASLSANK